MNSLVVKYFAKLTGLLDPHLYEDIAICVTFCKIAWILISQEEEIFSKCPDSGFEILGDECTPKYLVQFPSPCSDWYYQLAWNKLVADDIAKNADWEGCKQAELQGQMDSLAAKYFCKELQKYLEDFHLESFFISRFAICCIFGRSLHYPQDSAQCTLCVFSSFKIRMWHCNALMQWFGK